MDCLLNLCRRLYCPLFKSRFLIQLAIWIDTWPYLADNPRAKICGFFSNIKTLLVHQKSVMLVAGFLTLLHLWFINCDILFVFYACFKLLRLSFFQVILTRHVNDFTSLNVEWLLFNCIFLYSYFYDPQKFWTIWMLLVPVTWL